VFTHSGKSLEPKMPRTGRPAKPLTELKLAGSFREDRHGHRADAIDPPTVALPEPPTWMRETARGYWPELGSMLVARKLMSPIYATALAAFCDALADWVDLGKFTEDEATNPQWWTLKAKAWDRVMKSCREFGLTPSAIGSIKAPKTNEPPQSKARFFPNGPATRTG